ncbi:putative poly-beta-hydroxybutyrate polymerase [Caenibius tardaugens NBRC 16725]|uniref:Putative poly-beta-hydroxybutyrate polymerase n=1 Tax=Caenibius tardaugens NBRC 16725 TaxID=1219035 RepID=U2YKZ3_9SPHN|nr:class I poly(R)-hydroxyalkanoic acid synthase [Caenibius tardaugens]AZI36603.1 class I poly(R)-hydroxyalkanoic acid synthase [Caenibius tardaugens NBRC 16725]GAD49255.1 putative poly-beta-hydroxybutyrate polymerase [Caenibius tardaugens NBRC 16725]
MTDNQNDFGALINQMLAFQGEATQRWFTQMLPETAKKLPNPGEMAEWMDVARKLQALWLEFQEQRVATQLPPNPFADPAKWLNMAGQFYHQSPLSDPQHQEKLWADSLALWESLLNQYGIGPGETEAGHSPRLPREDRRFADEKWRSQPFFALVHQTYLMIAEELEAMVDSIEGLPDDRREQMRFATRVLIEALSPANFPLTNPAVLERTLETKGDNLVKGLQHLLSDLKRGQLTHTTPGAFTLGENVAVTPGEVVYQTPLFQLIQYTPVTDKVLETPLLIFPPWINRYYILDLNPKKSFIRWAVEQGLTVFVVSWKSADASMADLTQDDYIRAQIEAIEHVRTRLKVPSVHTIGYCVAGTTLAATLAVLARREEDARIASATFFTAQVDFEKAGDLRLFVDDVQLKLVEQLSGDGYLDGRYLAATFNLLRGRELIWNYVVNNYLMGEEYPAFDLLFWNSDTTNLPARWHKEYLRDLYRDNKLVVPDALSADGTPIDLTRITTPAYIQAGREDHISPPDSVFRMTRHLRGPMRFVLAGSGHIAGVVNPPAAAKYQYWINDKTCASIDQFIEGATEHPGSWWPDWIEWIRALGPKTVAARGKRKPGGKTDHTIESAPGSYVKTR